jgi:hypothetical protein
MPPKKDRNEIPTARAAQILFLSDRTCCVCRIKGKPVQIHHIDENPANNTLPNLAVLCFDCHTETQIRGGFHRKLDAEQVILYRDDWLINVARERAVSPSKITGTDVESQALDIELATSIAEIYREREEYELLALHYLSIGNDELRDKYIELAIEQGIDDEALIFFRGEQGRLDLVPKEVRDRHIKTLEDRSDWFSLGRLYRTLEEYEKAIKATCIGAISAIDQGNIFSAAFHLKEMVSDGALDALFISSFEKAQKQNDLWWQYRALQELEWYSEARDFLLEHQEEIEFSGEPHFIEELSIARGDTQRYVQLQKEEAESISAKRDLDVDDSSEA